MIGCRESIQQLIGWIRKTFGCFSGELEASITGIANYKFSQLGYWQGFK